MKDSFKPFRFEDQFEVEVDGSNPIQATNDKLVTIGSIARKCLTSNDFQQYKQMFNDELTGIMNAMVVYTANFGKSGNDNLDIYAVNMIRYVQRITDLRKLLTYVELDARKGIQTEEK